MFLDTVVKMFLNSKENLLIKNNGLCSPLFFTEFPQHYD